MHDGSCTDLGSVIDNSLRTVDRLLCRLLQQRNGDDKRTSYASPVKIIKAQMTTFTEKIRKM